ncbi:MAG: ParB N-terminal domain-containing protein [Lachnospiraceae bacterium]
MKEEETIEYLDLKTLVPFQNHPFKLRDGEEKEQLLQSIKTQGAIEPLIVRPLSESEYEVISGHRRLEICKNLYERTACYRPKSTDEQAVSTMVDATYTGKYIAK